MCTLFSQLFRVRVVLSRWTFHKKCFSRWGTKKMLYIQNWWTIPLKTLSSFEFFSHIQCSFEWAFESYPWRWFLNKNYLFIPFLHLRRVCLGEVRAEVAIFAAYIANYAKYSKLDSVFNHSQLSLYIYKLVFKKKFFLFSIDWKQMAKQVDKMLGQNFGLNWCPTTFKLE